METGELITPRQAIARLAEGEPLAFVDTRAADRRARTSLRIPGAFRLQLGAAARDAEALPRDAVLVVYGDHGCSQEPAAVAERLRRLGFEDVHVLAGGFLGWADLRCPIELATARPRAARGRARTARAHATH